MIRYVLDTNAFGEIARSEFGPVGLRVLTHGVDACGISVISTAELHYGVEWRTGHRLRARVERVLTQLTVLPFVPPADRIAGRLRADLRRRGTPIGPNDLLIAAHTLALDAVLVTDNTKEFARVPGLRYENWLRD